MDKERTFAEHMTAANAWRLKKNWAEALRELGEAKKISDLPEVKTAMDRVRHDECIDKARRALDSSQYDEAKAWVNQAKTYMTDAEDDKLLEEIEKGRKAAGGA